jgi:DNA helicase II / ATP-dependent DNA helicase PcrA
MPFLTGSFRLSMIGLEKINWIGQKVIHMKQFYNKLPVGSKTEQIPMAKMAQAKTSQQLILDSAEDAFYFRSLEKKGIFLNEPQTNAVRHFAGPMLTLSGAGSGKTSVLVHRAGYLVSVKKVLPENILLVTFTKKAANEMKERIAALPGLTTRAVKNIQACTFHSFFLTMLRKMNFNQEIIGNERFKQIIIKQILREMGLHDVYQPETLLAQLSAYKINMAGLADMPDHNPIEKELKQIFERYEQWKTVNHKWDFDDILAESYYLLLRNESLLKAIQNRFLYVMVDEFQDTNLLQYELIKLIVKPHQNLFVVGDDDQTIYTFNGARHEFILNFQKEFPQAKTITLDINYRSIASIVGLGNEVIRHNGKRWRKTLHSTKKSENTPLFSRPENTDVEAERIVQQIRSEVKAGARQYRDVAILFRTVSSSRAIFEQLALSDIPFISYSSGEQVFYEQWLVKPIIDHLRLALDPRNFSAMEGVLPALYINKEMGIAFIRRQETEKRKKYPMIYLESYPDLRGFHRAKIRERIHFIKELQAGSPLDAIKRIREEFYDKFIETDERNKISLQRETMKETLDELESSAKRFTTLSEFLGFIDQMTQKHKELEQLKKDPKANAISLMTIHRAKGLEFPVVYVIGLSEGILPHSSSISADKMDDMVTDKNKAEKVNAALEEERRLTYVAITRARDQLYLSSPAFYRGKNADISRFLLEAFSNLEGG